MRDPGRLAAPRPRHEAHVLGLGAGSRAPLELEGRRVGRRRRADAELRQVGPAGKELARPPRVGVDVGPLVRAGRRFCGDIAGSFIAETARSEYHSLTPWSHSTRQRAPSIWRTMPSTTPSAAGKLAWTTRSTVTSRFMLDCLALFPR